MLGIYMAVVVGAFALPEVVSERPAEGKADQMGTTCCMLAHSACTSLSRANGLFVPHVIRVGAQYVPLQSVLEVC